jgi:hypothetical protein
MTDIHINGYSGYDGYGSRCRRRSRPFGDPRNALRPKGFCGYSGYGYGNRDRGGIPFRHLCDGPAMRVSDTSSIRSRPFGTMGSVVLLPSLLPADICRKLRLTKVTTTPDALPGTLGTSGPAARMPEEDTTRYFPWPRALGRAVSTYSPCQRRRETPHVRAPRAYHYPSTLLPCRQPFQGGPRS